MPLENDLDKILIIGSGPTLIGSVSEMDIFSTEAIKALSEEGIQIVLVNPNPATIASDKRAGVTVYLEPMSLPFLKRILRMEEPDAILTSFGSTTALKVTQKLLNDGILSQMKIKLLGVTPQAIAITNSQKRVKFLNSLGITTTPSWNLANETTDDLEANLERLKKEVNFPVFVTKYHQYVHNEHVALKDISALIKYFSQENNNGNFSWKNYRITEDLSSWEEIIVDLIRDRDGNFVFTNIADSLEPIAINSGDSAIITPCLTLNNDEVIELRNKSKKIANKLQLVGPLSIHFAIKHRNESVVNQVLAIKPRLTRSSLLGERIGLYSAGYVSAKVCLGYRLSEITDPLSRLNAAIEPVLDTIAIKVPFFSFTESGNNHYYLNDLMQSSGEAIGVGRNFETAFLKAISSTGSFLHLWQCFTASYQLSKKELLQKLQRPDETHLVTLLAGIARGLTYSDLSHSINLHPVYFQKLQNLIAVANRLKTQKLDSSLLLLAKEKGFSDDLIAKLANSSTSEVRVQERESNIQPAYIQIDGTAGTFSPTVQAYYSAYGVSDENKLPEQKEKRVLIIGMPPLQASVTSEFDYMLVHAIKALKINGYQTILLSNNAESISAAYQICDRIYFDPIKLENILNVAHKEHINQVLLQFSGKRISAYRSLLAQYGLHTLGENQDQLKQRIEEVIGQQQNSLELIPSLESSKQQEIIAFAEKYGFPILVGAKTESFKQKSAIIYERKVLEDYLQENDSDNFIVSRFIAGRKYEITALSDGHLVSIPGIIEHLEQTGSHASDSIAVFKPQNLAPQECQLLQKYTKNLIGQLHASGLFNLHFLIVKNHIFLLQIKGYAGHNVAFLSKSIGKNITSLAVQLLIGKSFSDLHLPNQVWPLPSQLIHVKMPVFSFVNYYNHNSFDSHMKSSGSVMGRDTELAKALYKGYEASDLHIPTYGTIFISVRDQDKAKATVLAKRFNRLGFKLLATEGTANMFAEAGITTGISEKISQNPLSLLEKIRQHKIVMVINITNLSDRASEDAIQIRDQALYTHVPVFSSIETAELILKVLESLALTTQPI